MHEPRKQSGNLNCSEPVVVLAELTVGYNGHPALQQVDLCLPKGSLVGVVGPNGGGKSTLLKTILGLIRPWRGTVSILGRPPADARRLLGYVPQAEEVDWRFPVSALDVVLMGTYGRIGLLRRVGKRERDSALQCLERVGLAEVAERQIGELSGGQQQRVFLARALAQEPQVLLLDEPVSGVDAVSQHAVFELLESLSEEGVTVLATSHDLSCVANRFERVVCLNKRVIAYGNPDEVLTAEVLSETYESHLLTVKVDNVSYVVDSGLINR